MFSSPIKNRYLASTKKLEIDKKLIVDFLSFFKSFAVVPKNNYLKNFKKKLYYLLENGGGKKYETKYSRRQRITIGND